MAARKGLGVLGFSVGDLDEMEPVLDAYKKDIVNAEPVGAFVNDNVMVTSGAFVAEDRDRGRQVGAGRPACSYLQSNVFRYHDTFPHPEGVPYWPELIPDPTATIEVLDTRSARAHLRRPRRRARAVPAVGERRRRPAGLRRRDGHARRTRSRPSG